MGDVNLCLRGLGIGGSEIERFRDSGVRNSGWIASEGRGDGHSGDGRLPFGDLDFINPF